MNAMTDALVQFLRDRLNEDEKAARQAADLGQWALGEASDDERNWVYQGEYGSMVIECQRRADAIHIVRHDPARVLAEIQAHHTNVDEYEIALWAKTEPQDAACWEARRATLEEVCLRLATVYADHPECREEWRPMGAACGHGAANSPSA
ncbi:hypothetical protein G6045_08830 [Streptomyces sp. YC504]|uniref:Uncharacterized protein n=1 Tax=Streptomyces mesophilus TaxID=1775132 RepID=A0A6G4XDY8_9ACTN|nr:DUF6221 family protein [Streptomyces mesophilus]NGO75776.1 hypothetical protein [Streptomyces mesophilus]